MDTKDILDNMASNVMKMAGSDLSVYGIEETVKRTPTSNFTWSGLRGQSDCYPQDPYLIEKLAEYGQDSIRYSYRGEPDFSKVSVTSVKISNMNSSLQHDVGAADKKLLDTAFAKEHNLLTSKDVAEYRKLHSLSWHESSDGVTEYLIDKDIHSAFKHAGGRSEYRNLENRSDERIIQTAIGDKRIQFNRKMVATQDTINQTGKALGKVSGEFTEIQVESFNAAKSAALVATITAVVDNTNDVLNGNKTEQEALRDVAVNVGEVGATVYVQKNIQGITTRVISNMEKNAVPRVTGNLGSSLINQAPDMSGDIANVVIKTGEYFKKYYDDEIDADQMLEYTSQTITEQVVAFAGGFVGSFIPGGEMVGRYVATVLYNATRAVSFNKKQYSEYMAFMSAVAREASSQINWYRESFSEAVRKSNDKMTRKMVNAFKLMDEGYLNNDVEKATAGINDLADLIDAKGDVEQIDMSFLESNWIGE